MTTAVLAVLFSLGIPGYLVYRYPNYDRLDYWMFTAKLLAEVHKREKPSEATGKLPQEN